MSKNIIDSIEAAQNQLHSDIIAALDKFTENTGLYVPAMRWEIAKAIDCNGRAYFAKYWNIKSDLSTGMM